MGIGFLLNLIVWLILLAIVYLIGTAVIRKMGLGDPWPTILWLIIVLLIIVGVILPLFGYVTVHVPRLAS